MMQLKTIQFVVALWAASMLIPVAAGERGAGPPFGPGRAALQERWRNANPEQRERLRQMFKERQQEFMGGRPGFARPEATPKTRPSGPKAPGAAGEPFAQGRELMGKLREARQALHAAARAEQPNADLVREKAALIGKLEGELALLRGRTMAKAKPMIKGQPKDKVRPFGPPMRERMGPQMAGRGPGAGWGRPGRPWGQPGAQCPGCPCRPPMMPRWQAR